MTRVTNVPAGGISSSLDDVLPGLHETPLADGVRETVGRFRDLLAAGKVTA